MSFNIVLTFVCGIAVIMLAVGYYGTHLRRKPD